MKKLILFFLTPTISFGSCAQDSLVIFQIDSLVFANEAKVSTVLQKIEKNRIESMHGKNPDKISNVYRFTEDNKLISSTFTAYSIGDTEMIINLYYNARALIKAETYSFDMNNKRSEYNYYYKDNQLINSEVEMLGIHGGSYYIKYAGRILRRLKKKPIRFPS